MDNPLSAGRGAQWLFDLAIAIVRSVSAYTAVNSAVPPRVSLILDDLVRKRNAVSEDDDSIEVLTWAGGVVDEKLTELDGLLPAVRGRL
jgi:hypothetical protein